MRPVANLAPFLAVLALFGACLGEKHLREGCACGPERARGPGTSAPSGQRSDDVNARGSEPSVAPAPREVLAALPDFTDPAWTCVPSRAGKYLVCWRPLAGGVPRNEDFELVAWVLKDGVPVRDAHLFVSAWMPDHGHGMLRRPRAEARADGAFLVEGMLLHMRGHWQLFFEVLEGALAETAECALDL